MSGKVTILTSANLASSTEFVEMLTDTSCSVCGLSAEELDRWDRGEMAERRSILRALLDDVEARHDESVLIHDTLRNLVCLGRRAAGGWEFLPFEQGQRPPLETFLRRLG